MAAGVAPSVYISHDKMCPTSIPCILLNNDNVYFTSTAAPDSISSSSLSELNRTLLETNIAAVDVSVSGAQYAYELSPPLSLANGSVCDQSLSSPSAASSSISSATAANHNNNNNNNNSNHSNNHVTNNQITKSATKVRFCE